MQIEQLNITNFRNIEKTESFRLNPQFTVVIGVNGKGKSTLLHALRIACGAYMLGIPGVKKRHIHDSEIRKVDFETHLAALTPTVVEAIGKFYGETLHPWRRQIRKEGQKTTSNFEDVGEIRSIAAEKYGQINDLGRIDTANPVIAFFGTGRLHGDTRNSVGHYKGREVFRYGYYDWFDMKFGSYQYLGWLRSFSYLLSDGKETEESREAFFDAIKVANPYIEEVSFDGNELRIRTRLEDQKSQYLPLGLHSDGIITHTSMVAELAFRCLVLNSHYGRGAINKAEGVVMIDEIDLHIHPKWQRHIVSDLKNAFPKLQFVVTTHSPFIVQSLKSDELINLDKDTDFNPYELSIEEVAEDVMGVASPMSVENEESSLMAKQFLLSLDEATVVGPDAPDIQIDESKISDPGLRAFLEMKKLRKEYESSK